jgi:O-antigen ligase
MALYLALRAPGIAGWLYRAAIAVAIAAVLLTGSRTAFLASLAAFSFAFWTWRDSGWAQRIASLLLLVLLVLGALRLAPPASRQRLATVTAEISQGTLHNRTRIWKAGLRVFRRHPVAGVGAGAFPKAVEPRLGRPGLPGHEYVAHNTFLSVLVECGAVGFGLFFLLLAAVVFFIWVMPARQRPVWSVTLMVWSAGVSTLTWEHRKPTWLIFALIGAAWSRASETAREDT